MHEDMPVFDAQGIMAAARRGRAAAKALRDHTHPAGRLKAPAHPAPMPEHDNPWHPVAAETEKHPADGSSYKDHLVAVLGANGVHTSHPEIHGAIDQLTAAGRFTPFQGHALKAHNGPLKGDAGKAVLGAVAGHIAHT